MCYLTYRARANVLARKNAFLKRLLYFGVCCICRNETKKKTYIVQHLIPNVMEKMVNID